MKSGYIQTKIRPIKKLFIIEPFDSEAFMEIFTNLQNEIDSIQNLIFVNDGELFTTSNFDFVKRSDPDVILNLSKLDNDVLSNYFDISAYNPNYDQFKIGRFGTTLASFHKEPDFFKRFNESKNEDFVVLCAKELKDTEDDLFFCINFGLYPEEISEHLELTIFNNLKPKFITNIKDAIENIFQKDNKFSHLTNFIGGFAGFGNGTSVYEIDYNREAYFDDKRSYLIVSNKSDFKTISYFWNTRSYYPNSQIAWLPVELLKSIKTKVDNTFCFVCFNETVKVKIKNEYPLNEVMQPSRLHFRSRTERWTYFEYSQPINYSDESVIIQHPINKSFSDMGYAGAYVLETRGLEEFAYPKHRTIGKLFFHKYHDSILFPERFLRMGEKGLSKYILEFSPLQANDIFEEIKLPSFNTVIDYIFNDIGYEIKNTPKTSVFEQSLNLIGGLAKLEIISKENIFNLLVSLTPNVRTEKVVNKLIQDVKEKVSSSSVLEIIAEIRERGGVNFPSVTATLEEIISKIKLSGYDKKQIFLDIQNLYNQGVLLRGKYFSCPYCKSKLWIQIHEISKTNYCTECNNEVNIPIYFNDKQSSDYYRLNQLIVRAVDQGQLSTLLLLNFFNIQKYRAFNYLSNIELYKKGKLITDIDLLVKIGKKIGLIECKSTGGFSENQIDEIILIGKSIKCDFIAFSCLNELKSDVITELQSILSKKSFEFPAFIFSKESLFNPKDNMIQKHFERGYSDIMKIGPIVIS